MTNEKNLYRNRSSERIRKNANAGSKMAPTFEVEIDKNGHKNLVKTGETNTYVLIQQGLEDSKIENILARAGMGDVNALFVRQGSYGDFTDTPKTLAEAQKMIIKVNQEFEKLPTEIKNKFDNSPEKYVELYGSKDWEDKVGITHYNEQQAIAKANKEALEKMEKTNNGNGKEKAINE